MANKQQYIEAILFFEEELGGFIRRGQMLVNRDAELQQLSIGTLASMKKDLEARFNQVIKTW